MVIEYVKIYSWRCASSALEIEVGEIPTLVKFSEQPVLSLGAEAARLGLSVGKGA